jgi:glutamate---cysteine ligase / carboxylate-amine ligase
MPQITLGLEEELQVVDARTLSLCSHDLEVGKARFPDQPAGCGTTSGEAHRFILEVQTPACKHPDEIARNLQGLRQIAAVRAADQGQLVFAASLHPFADWRALQRRENSETDPHYAHLFEQYQDVARQLLSCGTHIHLGVEDPVLRLHVLNGMREVLPQLLALSASSPFFDGRDTGLESWRHSLLDIFPRMGITDPWQSVEGYWEHVHRLKSTGCLGTGVNLWGDIRLHHVYPTVEIRILDSMPRLSRTWLVTTLLQLHAQFLCAQAEAGKTKPYQGRELVIENKWRARRDGLDAKLVDWDRDEERPVASALTQWVEELTPYAKAAGLQSRLRAALEAALAEGTSAREQRTVYAITGDPAAVVLHLVNQTARVGSVL